MTLTQSQLVTTIFPRSWLPKSFSNHYTTGQKENAKMLIRLISCIVSTEQTVSNTQPVISCPLCYIDCVSKKSGEGFEYSGVHKFE